MRHGHRGGNGRHHSGPDERPDHPHSRKHHGGPRRGGPGRLFDYGELRLVLLALIAEEPRHGYELIKLIEERSGGSYDPSPGVIYPTLTWLDDMGYARAETDDGGRKRYSLTGEGRSFLDANSRTADELLARLAANEGHRPTDVPLPVIRAMQNLKTAMRLRLRRGALDEASSEQIATALDAAVKIVERS